ncbi:MAG: (2Fe-2S) ferredoxin domain-containing protein, partial [Limnochordia bacterium]
MRSMAELLQLKAEIGHKLADAELSQKPKIIVGMGTCGIAAGARDTLEAIREELEKAGVDAALTQTGCIGMCEQEPLVDVQLPGEDRITYGKV